MKSQQNVPVMTMEDYTSSDDEAMDSGRTTQNSTTSGKLPLIHPRSQSRASISTSGSRSLQTTPKNAWGELSSENNSPVPIEVVRKANEYLGHEEARRRALLIEQQRALTEYMICNARTGINDMSATDAIPTCVNSSAIEKNTYKRIPRIRRQELSGIGVTKSENDYDPTLFTMVRPLAVKGLQLPPLSSAKPEPAVTKMF